MDDRITRCLRPEEFVALLTSLDLGEFLRLQGDRLLLLIKLDDPSGELMTGLATADLSKDQLKPNLSVMGFNTIVAADHNEVSAVAEESQLNVVDLRSKLLRGAEYFVAPLRKREGDSTYMERISLGRARNKDVVLRHRSISKFHAWFEMDEAGAFYLADAGSKNGTKLNGRPLAPRERTVVRAGDVATFGGLDAILCPPELLWRAAHRELGDSASP